MSFFEAMFGDDFPGTFAIGDGRSCKSMKTLLDLPAEILEIIGQYLSGLDIKRSRLTCRELAEKVQLRIDRAYISPNRANLDRLNLILDHPQYRLRVQEIVWDDAQLVEYPTIEHFSAALAHDRYEARKGHIHALGFSGTDRDADYGPIDVDKCTQEDDSLARFGKPIIHSSNIQITRDMNAGNAAEMSVEESYALYQKLYQDEIEIIRRGWDVGGLQRALTGFPQLKRIILTSEVWRASGSLLTYETPFFRALPPGFQKPSVSPWRQTNLDLRFGETAHSSQRLSTKRHLPATSRGYSIIVSLLETNSVPQLEAFAIDGGTELQDLSHLFAMQSLDHT